MTVAPAWDQPGNCKDQYHLFHAPDGPGAYQRSTPDPAIALCRTCPVLARCRLEPPPKLDHPWVVQAGRVWRQPGKPKTKEQADV